MDTNLKLLSAALTGILITLASANAFAISSERRSSANAVGRCQGALPNYEGALRKRPLALQNEGSSSVFVTCAFLSDQDNTDVLSFGLYARTTRGVDTTLNCTAVMGYETGTVEYSAKSVVLEANGIQNFLFWGDADFPVAGEIAPSEPITISCSLPAGVGLNDMYFNYSEDVGS